MESRELGIGRNVKLRALALLSKAGLVQISYTERKSPVVDILDCRAGVTGKAHGRA